MSYDTQFTRYLFTFFSLAGGILLNRATFSPFSRWIFDNFDHDPSLSSLSRASLAHRVYIIIPLFSFALSIRQWRNIFFRHRDSDLHHRDILAMSTRRTRKFPKSLQFSSQQTANTTTKRRTRWLRFLRLVSWNSPFKGLFPPFSDAHSPPPLIPSTSTVT